VSPVGVHAGRRHCDVPSARGSHCGCRRTGRSSSAGSLWGRFRYVVIMFEMTILFGALSTILGSVQRVVCRAAVGDDPVRSALHERPLWRLRPADPTRSQGSSRCCARPARKRCAVGRLRAAVAALAPLRPWLQPDESCTRSVGSHDAAPGNIKRTPGRFHRSPARSCFRCGAPAYARDR